MDPTSTELDMLAVETTGDHTRQLDDDRSMVIVMYDDAFAKRKLAQIQKMVVVYYHHFLDLVVVDRT